MVSGRRRLRWSGLDSRLLEYFVAVAECGSFTKAAEKLHIAQPSLSQAIHRLENECGTPLFHRTSRKVVLSQPGEQLLGAARRVLHDIEVARSSIAAVRGLHKGTIAVAVPPSFSVVPTAALVGTFARAHPHVRVSLLPVPSSAAAIEAVLDTRCELAITDGREASLRTHPIGRSEMVLIAPPDSDLADRTEVDRSELAKRPFVSNVAGTMSRAVLDEMVDEVGVEVVVDSPHQHAVIPLVAESLGYGLLPTSFAREAERRGLAVLSLSPRIAMTITLVHRDEPLTPAAEEFVTTAVRTPAAGEWAGPARVATPASRPRRGSRTVRGTR
ncbi:MAG: LysR family transcriptional regulator [Pseudonocardiaceae bacterium]|nr:LysR family transcriptional regulator [Pseudonocardiaceae bacterium]